MRTAIQWIGILAILLVAGAAGADGVVKGRDLVVGKDLAEQTVQIGAETLHVTAKTTIRLDGQAARLEDVPVPKPEGGTPLSEMRWGIYEARPLDDRLELKSLELVQVPR